MAESSTGKLKTKRRGRHPVNALSDRSVRSAETGWHCDGNCLYVVVQPSGSRSWIQRITIHGRRREIGLGGFPAVSLRDARVQAVKNLQVARQGGDPLAEKQRDRRVPTFSAAAAEVLKRKAPGWRNAKHAKQWKATLEQYVYPRIGQRPVSEVTAADVLAVLNPIWHNKPETARRVRQRIGAVLEWAAAMDYRSDNPCERLKQTLPKQKDIVQHMPALPHAEVSAAIKTVQDSRASTAAKLVFEFTVLTAARSGEARLARWDEIDLPDGVWTIPGARMKAHRPHRVPLSRRAVQILATARDRLDGASGLVFPGPRGRALSDMALSKLLREHRINAVPHGFRSSFRDWAAEKTNHPRQVVEAALAHVIPNKTEAAYARSDLFDRRRRLMDDWAAYVDR